MSSQFGLIAQKLKRTEAALAGNSVLLPDGVTTLPAEFLTEPRAIQRVIPPDGMATFGSKTPFVFVFSADALGRVAPGQKVLFNGVHYTITPRGVYPKYWNNACVHVTIACVIN